MKYNYSKALIELRSKLDISQTELTFLFNAISTSLVFSKKFKFNSFVCGIDIISTKNPLKLNNLI